MKENNSEKIQKEEIQGIDQRECLSKSGKGIWLLVRKNERKKPIKGEG